MLTINLTYLLCIMLYLYQIPKFYLRNSVAKALLRRTKLHVKHSKLNVINCPL
jgi:hypothetical protein